MLYEVITIMREKTQTLASRLKYLVMTFCFSRHHGCIWFFETLFPGSRSIGQQERVGHIFKLRTFLDEPDRLTDDRVLLEGQDVV